MKIDKIIYNNFRNYKGEQIFKLNNYITILYGDNGNGKSSFFDGIEWCLTGTIARFLDKRVRKEALANKNIKSGEECFVEIHFPTFFIRRAFGLNDTGFGNIDFSLFIKNEYGIYEKKANGESNVDLALRKIFEENGVKYRDVKYKVGEIINKAYILSQDQVADFVTRDKPSERYNALASIMGFERVLKIRKNLNTSLKCFNEAEENLVLEWENSHEKKRKLQSNLKEINHEVFNKFKYLYNFEPESSSDVERELKKIQSSLFDIEQQSKEIEQFNLIDADTVEEVEVIIGQKKEAVFLIEKSLKEQLVEENKLEEEKKEIQQTLIKLSENDKVRKTFEEVTKSINEFSNKLIALKMENEDSQSLKEYMNHLYENNRKIEFQKKNKEEYTNAKSFINEFADIFTNKQEQLKKEQEILKRILTQKILAEEDLLKVDGDSSLNNLIKSIENIYNYVEKNNINDLCPVCSSNVNNDLGLRISNNLNQIINETKEKKDIVVQKLKEKEEIEIKETVQKNLIQSLEFDIKKLETKYKVSKQTIVFIEENELFSEYFTISEKELSSIESSNIQKLNLYQTARELHEKIKNLKEKLNTIYIDQNLISVDFQVLKSKLTTLEEQSKVIKGLILEKEREISDFKTQIYKMEEVKNQFIKYFSKYNVNSISVVKITLKKRCQELETTLELLKSLLPIIENKHFNQGINGEIVRIDEEINNVNKKLKKVAEKSGIIRNILSKLDSEYGEEATNFLNTNRSTIQTYYRYLNPTPAQFNNLFFEVINNEELYIKIMENIKHNEEEFQYFADANMVLSSGQLNVLALAIFIATNEAQNCSYFDFIAIDDPIQNMDDINRFSICDVLSQLNRQLLFSTHDQEFLNLFLKKNEYQIDKVTLYMLNADENQYMPLSLN
ncbi:AAA family ATPase [Bacillus pretiosus]